MRLFKKGENVNPAPASLELFPSIDWRFHASCYFCDVCVVVRREYFKLVDLLVVDQEEVEEARYQKRKRRHHTVLP